MRLSKALKKHVGPGFFSSTETDKIKYMISYKHLVICKEVYFSVLKIENEDQGLTKWYTAI